MDDNSMDNDANEHIQQQIDNLDEQIEQINDNPEIADPQKEREVKKLELVKAQLVEGEQKQIDARQQTTVYGRDEGFND